ncbi:MAG TPA: outer membrane protein assembly factor BamE [Ramlibacter sp.]|jgi:outer membrane protein assembly factor BamE (lipoprotein component of BamABCDE complex)|uniref:outer membrane protein assembly factor BamE n=1 Tax=Ramlibacter sp. TaxID=1917967 RepID=UPI002D73ABEF|nr:outer membrane protein assembly factor BamE [Ramlibacter sp.]HZY17545.1 outer membrane protein assembly factor BamE [Ramlibacter sp.]
MRLVSGVLAVLAALAGCDQRRISQLEEGVSTEADVRAQFGQPENVWDEPDGTRTLEYNRNPQGHQNYMVSIGPAGKMTALRQVLNPVTFARVQPGMPMEQVRRMLGKPAKRTPYPLKGEEAWDWRFMQPPNTSMYFTVWFDRDLHVLRSSTGPDTDSPEIKGGK